MRQLNVLRETIVLDLWPDERFGPRWPKTSF